MTKFGHEGRCNETRLAGAFLQNFFNLSRMRHQLFIAGAHWPNLAVNLVGKMLFGFAPTEAGTQFRTEVLTLFGRGECVEDDGERGAVGILRFARRPAVGNDASDGGVKRCAAAFKERNDVVVGLAHLAPVEPREHLDAAAARCLR